MISYHLPDDLLDDGPSQPDEVVIRFYNSARDSVKNRIVLNQNMINVLISGTKTIIYPEATAVVQAGELVVLSTGNVLTSELLAGTNRFTSVLFYFSNEVFNRFLIKYDHLIKGNAPTASRQPFLIFKQDNFISHFITSLMSLLSNGGTLPAEVRQLRMEELLLYLLHADPQRFHSIQIITRDRQQLQIKKSGRKSDWPAYYCG